MPPRSPPRADGRRATAPRAPEGRRRRPRPGRYARAGPAVQRRAPSLRHVDRVSLRVPARGGSVPSAEPTPRCSGAASRSMAPSAASARTLTSPASFAAVRSGRARAVVAAVPPDRPGSPHLRPMPPHVPAGRHGRRLGRDHLATAGMGLPGVLPRDADAARRLRSAARRLLRRGGRVVTAPCLMGPAMGPYGPETCG
jgi:hypothetical protein